MLYPMIWRQSRFISRYTVPNGSKKMKEIEGKRYWLIKSEPETRMEKGIDMKFGIEDLKKEPDQTACWDGVRYD